MVSLKALAAIALTLIIAVPIGAGYALSLHDEEITNWESTNTSNISDALLNAESPYYTDYTGPNNNSEVFYKNIGRPDYVSVSNVASSLPVYNYTLQGTPANVDTVTGNLAAGQTIGSRTNTIGGDPNVILSGVQISFELSSSTGSWELWMNGSKAFNVNTMYLFNVAKVTSEPSFDGFGPWEIRYGSDYYIVDTWFLKSVDGSAYKYSIATGNTIDLNTNGTYVLYPLTTVAYDSVNTIEFLQSYDNHSLVVNNKSVWVDTTYIGTPSEVVVFTTSPLTKSVQTPTGSYADPVAGWRLSNEVRWFNGFQNGTVQMYLDLTNGSSTTFDVNGSTWTVSKAALGQVSVNHDGKTQSLGNYRYVMIQFGSESTAITGMLSWPAANANPSTGNSLNWEEKLGMIGYIGINGSSTITYRVEKTSIYSGYSGLYPTTKNLTFDPDNLFPNTSYTVVLNSFAFYGDSLGFAGETYAVTDGSITVDGKTVSLRSLEFSSWKQVDGTWENRIGNKTINATESPATMYFGGEWSLTAQRFTMEEVKDTALVWHAGEFAFSREDFVACGLLVCAACFLGLGMTGRASGGKAMLLALVCGGAGLGFLTIL